MSQLGFITRPQMVDMMASTFNAEVTERLGHNWRRVNTIVAEQGDMEFADGVLGFHMFEVCQSGRHEIEIETALETGDRGQATLMAGGLSYVPRDLSTTQVCEGHARIQQIYVDHSIFHETAASLIKGDPDRIEFLGFQGIFEPQLRCLASSILDEARAPTLGSELQVDLLAQQMALVILRRRLGDQVRKPMRRALSNSELSRVIDFLESDLAEGGGMDTLAGLIDMDVFTFTKAFKRSTGQPPHKFLMERRLARVKDLLIQTNDSLADISFHTGFSSQPHMTAAFSKAMQMPPGAFRKKYRP